MLNRDPERFESPKLGDEVRTVKMSRWENRGLSCHSLARPRQHHLGLPLYAQGFVRFCSWERAESEERYKNFALSPVVGSQRGGVSLNLQGHADGQGVLALAHRGSTAMAAD